MHLAVRELLFTLVVPGSGAAWIPWWILSREHPAPQPAAWPAVVLIAPGLLLYLACLWVFAVLGRGTPGPWDAPRRLVVVGPYRWVRNPIYLAALMVVAGEAWLFLSPSLLLYAFVLAIAFHLFVAGYEEPTLSRRFGADYAEYRRTVPRWVPRPRRRH